MLQPTLPADRLNFLPSTFNIFFSALEWNLVISVFRNLFDIDLGIPPIRRSRAETEQTPASVLFVNVTHVLPGIMLRKKVKRDKI